ncbi:MAG TPA: phosphatase PAP2 family protein [Thermomicrobiaceae bacterium]|nr:phosphatase PAP2 family protein [Thermomicrobiaceae bacterium]
MGRRLSTVDWGSALRYFGRALLEFAILLVAFGVHELLRGLAAGTLSESLSNARGLIGFEQRVGLFQGAHLQHWVLAQPRFLLDLLDFAYIHMHMVCFYVFLAWVCLFHLKDAPKIRWMLIAIFCVAVPTYYFYPLAPPRYFPQLGFVDTVKVFGGVNYDANTGILANSFAAMPSLHAGWAMFEAIGYARLSRYPWRWLGFVYWVWISIAVVATANHYIMDVLAGTVLAIGVWVLIPLLLAALPWTKEHQAVATRAGSSPALASGHAKDAAPGHLRQVEPAGQAEPADDQP